MKAKNSRGTGRTLNNRKGFGTQGLEKKEDE